MGVLGELWVKLGLKNDGLRRGLDESKNKVSLFSKTLSKMGGVMAAAFSAKAIFDFTKKVSELANQVDGVKKAFNKIASPTLLQDLRRATQGTVTDLQLMQRAVQANNFKIPLENLATYLEFATKRAQETGQSVDYLVDSIVTGLGRQSVLILDNLGISAKEIRDRMKDGGTMADAIGEIIKESMGDAAESVDNAAVSSQRFSAAWQNLMASIGSGTGIKNAWNSVLGWMAGKLDKATKVFELETVGTGIKLLNILSGGIIGGALIDEEIAKKEYNEAPIGPEIPDSVRKANAKGTIEESETVRGLINQLEAEIKAKTDIRNLSDNNAEIDSLNEEIKKLEERLNLLKMTKEERMNYRNEQQVQIEKIDSIFDIESLNQNTDEAVAIMDDAYNRWLAHGERLNQEALAQQQILNDLNAQFSAAIAQGLSNSIQELVNAIMGVENANAATVISALLTPMCDALVSAGEMIMTMGIAVEVFKSSLTSLNGYAAIAAGAALIAVASAVKAGLKSLGSNPTGTSMRNESVTSYSGGYNSQMYNYNNEYTLTTTLKGSDLLLAIEREQNNKKR